MPLHQTQQVTSALMEAYEIAADKRHEFLTPEHLLAGFLKDRDFWEVLNRCGKAEELESQIYGYLNGLESVSEDAELAIESSAQLNEIFETAAKTADAAMVPAVQLHHIIYSYFHLEESYARYYLETYLECSIPDFLNTLAEVSTGDGAGELAKDSSERYFKEIKPFSDLVGRKTEMDKIIRILSRKGRNNVLLAGGHGVGKTTIVKGLASLILDEKVPARLQDTKLMELDINSLLSGTQYRGELEGRIQNLMDMAESEGNRIIYIDELKSLGVGGRQEESSRDLLSLMNRYLKSEQIRFIISGTYEEIKKVSSSDGGTMNLFRQVDIDEPSDAETAEILNRATGDLEEFHGVTYAEGSAEHAISMSRRYIMDRCLPDKAIDLLDEAGAYASTRNEAEVTEKTIDLALADICRTDVQASDEEVRKDLFEMENKLSERIYGQKEAIKTVSEAILMSKAGLLDSGKTIGNFLFVGPTGVGKTELARVLAQQLHVPLHRFDMSEYTEKHSVAKLIGSPAGYVGYDDGGILTDTIRKNPYCVLLLDEIEKAHEDIYNLLLQVMDYAVITDNKGRKIDFRNVVVIMTSNAGARYAGRPSVGFERKVNAGAVMAKEIRNVFAPEFINRLSSVVIFNDINEEMAKMILKAKIKMLERRIADKGIILEISDDAFDRLLKEGFSSEYGAREIERTLNSRITPLLMKEILFGAKENFKAIVRATDEGYKIEVR